MKVLNRANAINELDQVWGLRPEAYAAFMEDYNASIARVDPVLLELCRLRMSTLLGCTFSSSLRYGPAIAAGLTEEKISALPNYPDSPLFSKNERAGIEFTEQFVIQASAIGDEHVEKLQAHLGAEPMIYFLKAISVMDQLQRSAVAFSIGKTNTIPQTMPNFRLAA